MINTGKVQEKYGDNYPTPGYITPINNEAICVLNYGDMWTKLR